MTPPEAEYRRPKWLPLPRKSAIEMAHFLWDDLEPFVNTPPSALGANDKEPERLRVYQKMRNSLQALAAGRLPPEDKPIMAPAVPLAVVIRHGSVAWTLRRLKGGIVGSAEDIGAQCRFLLCLLALPEVRRLLKRCRWCRHTFWLGKSVRKDKTTDDRSEYCPACREPAYRAASALRVRKYRNRDKADDKAGLPPPTVRLLLRECATCDTLFRTTRRPKKGERDYCDACRARASRDGKRRRPSDPGRRFRA